MELLKILLENITFCFCSTLKCAVVSTIAYCNCIFTIQTDANTCSSTSGCSNVTVVLAGIDSSNVLRTCILSQDTSSAGVPLVGTGIGNITVVGAVLDGSCSIHSTNDTAGRHTTGGNHIAVVDAVGNSSVKVGADTTGPSAGNVAIVLTAINGCITNPCTNACCNKIRGDFCIVDAILDGRTRAFKNDTGSVVGCVDGTGNLNVFDGGCTGIISNSCHIGSVHGNIFEGNILDGGIICNVTKECTGVAIQFQTGNGVTIAVEEAVEGILFGAGGSPGFGQLNVCSQDNPLAVFSFRNCFGKIRTCCNCGYAKGPS